MQQLVALGRAAGVDYPKVECILHVLVLVFMGGAFLGDAEVSGVLPQHAAPASEVEANVLVAGRERARRARCRCPVICIMHVSGRAGAGARRRILQRAFESVA